MTKLRLALCVLSVALVAASVSLGKEKNWNDVIAELKEAKQTATDLVGQMLTLQPSKDDLLEFRQKYDLAKEKYFMWAEEAADAAEHGKNISIKSDKSQAARERLTELSKFATDYAKAREKQDEKVFGLAPKQKQTNSNPQNVAQGALNIMNIAKDIEAFAKGLHDAEITARQQAAKDIREGANWPDFGTIK
jgi:hypothetical protein